MGVPVALVIALAMPPAVTAPMPAAVVAMTAHHGGTQQHPAEQQPAYIDREHLPLLARET